MVFKFFFLNLVLYSTVQYSTESIPQFPVETRLLPTNQINSTQFPKTKLKNKATRSASLSSLHYSLRVPTAQGVVPIQLTQFSCDVIPHLQYSVYAICIN